MSGPDIAWCPGCGNFPVLRTLNRAIENVGIDRRKLVLVSGIGQAAKLPHYTDANVFNGPHGRALALVLKWGDEIAIGIIYRSRRPSFESRLPALREETLLVQLDRAGAA